MERAGECVLARRLLIVAGVFVVLHLIVILTMGTSPAGSFFANSLQIAASGIASAMAFGAARRGRGLSRSLWLLVGFAWATWGIANFGWTFYEVVLRVEPPALSFVRFLFDIQGAFFAMALFLDDARDSTRLDFATILDFLQIAAIYFLIYLVMFYLPSVSLDHHGAMRRVQFIMLIQNGALIGLSVIRAGIARSPSTKALYRNFAIFLAIYCSLAQVTEFVQYLREMSK